MREGKKLEHLEIARPFGDEPGEALGSDTSSRAPDSGGRDIEPHMELVKALLGSIDLETALVDPTLGVIWANSLHASRKRERSSALYLCELLECTPKGSEKDSPCSLCPLSRAIREALEEGTRLKRFEAPWPPIGVPYKEMRFSIRPIPYEKDGKALITVSWQDITREKISELRLQEANRELEDANKQLASALEKANLLAFQAQAANIAKSAFLARMSHEIRTPLNAVIGYCELLMEGKVGEEERTHLKAIYTSAQALLSLIDDILDFSRIEAGEMRLDSVPFDPRALVKETCEMVRPRIHDKPIRLSFKVDHKVPKILVGDPGRTRQVLLNLLSNACKFTNQGHIKLRVMLKSAEEERARVIFRVSDSGIGIPPKRLEEIFEPFRQLDDTLRRAHGGTGLGLAICRQLAHLMDGKVWAKSKVGKGSTFFFEARYGIRSGEPEAFHDASHAHSPSRATADGVPSKDVERGLEILLVEDNHLNGRLASLMLERAGHRVIWAQDGWQALRVATDRREQLDLILMDVEMPGMDGLEVTRRIRALGLNGIPIVAMTAHAMKEDRERCLSAGMNDYLSKPIRKDLLLEKVDRWSRKGGM
jgi:two-component system sensor histidine kinase/response regulator